MSPLVVSCEGFQWVDKHQCMVLDEKIIESESYEDRHLTHPDRQVNGQANTQDRYRQGPGRQTGR